MVLQKLLQLFGVQQKGSKKKGKSIDALWPAPAPYSKVSLIPDNLNLDPSSSGLGTILPLQKHEPECSTIVPLATNIEHGINTNDDTTFKQFDVVQDFSDHHYAKNAPGKTSKEWGKKIQQEWRLLEKDLPGSICVRVYEDRMDLLRAAITGPAGTPYHDGLFFFDIRFPPEYPRCPPKVHYHSGGLRINPNMYESGKVCLSLLNTWWGTGCEKWSKSNSTILQVLVSIQGLVLNEKPYFNEPGNKNMANTVAGEKNSLAYNQTTFLLSCKTMLYSLRKPPKHFENLVACHFHERERAILEACRAYMACNLVGSSIRSSAQSVGNKCSAEFSKSLQQFSDQLSREFVTNKIRALKLRRDASPAAEIVSIN